MCLWLIHEPPSSIRVAVVFFEAAAELPFSPSFKGVGATALDSSTIIIMPVRIQFKIQIVNYLNCFETDLNRFETLLTRLNHFELIWITFGSFITFELFELLLNQFESLLDRSESLLNLIELLLIWITFSSSLNENIRFFNNNFEIAA